MAKAFSKALNKSIEIKRILGKVQGKSNGATVVFIAGMHGNEPSGVFALNSVLKTLQESELSLNGTCYALVGNLKAMDKGVRFLDEDLNRLWTTEHIGKLLSEDSKKTQETPERLEILSLLRKIISEEAAPFYFIDLHTTSSKTIPFTIANDTLLNRDFVSQYPVPMILGIEEYITGPLLSYINELGYISYAYESGEHDELKSIDYHESFIWLTLVFSGLLKKSEVDFDQHFKSLADTSAKANNTYEIIKAHKIAKNDVFKMKGGFKNFQKIAKGDLLATSNENKLVANEAGRIFMPLYQSHGQDGYFIIKKISALKLWVSSFLRRLKFDRLLPLMPGVSVHPEKREWLFVNRKVARFFAKEFFHLLGYRSQRIVGKYLIIMNRETHSKREEYLT